MQSTDTILIVLTCVIGALVLIQSITMFAMLMAMRKSARTAHAYADEMKAKMTPVLDLSREMMETAKHLITRLEPKLEAAASDLAEMTRTASEELKKIEASADEISERLRRQAARVDSMTSSALDGVDRAGRLLNSAVATPVRQVTGVLAAAKAIVDALKASGQGRRRSHDDHARDDQFV